MVLADLLVAVDLLLLVAPLVVEDLLLLPVGYGIGPPPPVPAVAGPAPRPVLMADPDPLTRRDLTGDSQAVVDRAVREMDWPMSNKMVR